MAYFGDNQLTGHTVVKTDRGVGCRDDLDKEVALIASANQLTGRVVVKTDRGVGWRDDVDKEMALIAIAFCDDKQVVESDDHSKPWCYHESRDNLLLMANALRAAGHLEQIGFDGPAVKLAIPGIPIPQGIDATGNQAEDIGPHLTLWVRPASAANGTAYMPPSLELAVKLTGEEVTMRLLPPDKGLMILVAGESNDMKTGACYYLCNIFDDDGTKTANSIKERIGLQADATQKFHVTIAGLAPSWQEVHPKSLIYRSAPEEQKRIMNLEEDFQVFRKGGVSGVESFGGFNADAVTGWSTYASQAAAMGQENGGISKAVAELAKQTQNGERDAKMAELNRAKKDVIKELGFPKSISKDDAEMLKSALPEYAAQENTVAAFASKRKDILDWCSRVDATDWKL